MKKIFILIISSIILTGCVKGENQNIENSLPTMMEKGNYIILDVRTKEEYELSHIKDAINIPYDEIDEGINLDKSKTIFVYCQSGRRSEIAWNTLNKLGYTTYDLGAFSEIDLPTEE